jgi:hypothetical protein
MKIVTLLMSLSLCLILIPLTSNAVDIRSPDSHGTIKDFSIEEKHLLINETLYRLDDRLSVVSKDNIVVSDSALRKDQKIEVWLGKPEQNLPNINRIRILSDVNTDY